ncbi:DNA-binding protein [Halalkalibacter akibai JCM 9157]|uniref:DNA-binding protein n=1 Tax=Halalkalibacter akibai (strain ATCC 43226 / DSM 21942 / CIP 109018 / JCM 9157 / 1139) TaxID=1236973 RepID=W4QYZ5_HALA3|nr:DNA-binding protein [Halalkalibacter akibai JCM 9157]
MSVSVLGEVERGNRLPSEPVVERMATVLNISKQDFIS